MLASSVVVRVSLVADLSREQVLGVDVFKVVKTSLGNQLMRVGYNTIIAFACPYPDTNPMPRYPLAYPRFLADTTYHVDSAHTKLGDAMLSEHPYILNSLGLVPKTTTPRFPYTTVSERAPLRVTFIGDAQEFDGMKSHIAELIKRLTGAGFYAMYLNTVCGTDDGNNYFYFCRETPQ